MPKQRESGTRGNVSFGPGGSKVGLLWFLFVFFAFGWQLAKLLQKDPVYVAFEESEPIQLTLQQIMCTIYFKANFAHDRV